MSFFTLSTGEKAVVTGSFETNTNLPPIPANTELKAAVDEAENKTNSNTGEQYIELRWNILAGEYKGRKVFQKIRHSDADPKKADKAKMMLMAIDANCGGKLVKLNRAPTDQDLMVCLTGKPMGIKVQVWSMKNEQTGETSTGNWVSAVSGSGASRPAPAAPKQNTPAQDVAETEAALGGDTPVDDDDLGFG